mgnify:CR=1 FL=1
MSYSQREVKTNWKLETNDKNNIAKKKDKDKDRDISNKDKKDN